MLTAPRRGQRRVRWPLTAALALVALAAGFLVWSAVEFFSAGSDVDQARTDLTLAQERLEDLREDDAVAIRTARDEALKAGRDAVVTMNTLDYRDVDAGLDKWAEVTTGSLHDEVVNGRGESKQAIENAKSVTKVEVITSAVKAVDERAGTATVLVALKVNVSTSGNDPTDKYMRIEGTVFRTDQGWKLDGIKQVPYSS